MSEEGQSPSECELEEELQQQDWKKRESFSKELSMCRRARAGDIAWERRRRQILRQERKRKNISQDSDDLTDDDLNELRGCIELGFGFNEEDGQKLCNTLPALDLYFAVNRRLSPSPASSPHSRRSVSFESTSSPPDSDNSSWKILSPGNFID